MTTTSIAETILAAYPFEHQPSKYHQAIYEKGLNSNKSLAIEAVAGGSKTTTIVNLAKMLQMANPNIKILFLAFNKAIVEELKERLPNIDVRTTHSLGMKLIAGESRPKVDNSKIRSIIKLMLPHWNLAYDMEEADIKEYCQRVEKLCNLGRLFICKKKDELIAIAEKYAIDIFNGELEKVVQVMTYANTHNSTIDFVDMIYQPVRRKEKFKNIQKYDVVISDEAQDYNKCQLELSQLVTDGKGRMIFVYDSNQAIYGFAGADSESTKRIESLKIRGEKIQKLPLSVSYRCGKNIIKLVNQLLPHIKIEAFDKNPDGEVDFTAKMGNIKSGDMVLCRMNLPMIRAFYFLIKNKRVAYIKGRDMGTQMINYIKRSKKKGLDALTNWMEKDLDKLYEKIQRMYPHFESDDIEEHTSYVYLSERIEIITEIIAQSERVVDVETLIQEFSKIFREKGGGICLSSVHRSKGLEADRVFILRDDLLPFNKKSKKKPMLQWEKQQEKNLQYVAYTRAKLYLGFISDWSTKNEYTGKAL